MLRAIIERILFLEGTPNMVTRDPIQVGHDVPTMLQNDLNVEYHVGALLKKTMALCEAEQDYVTRSMLQNLVRRYRKRPCALVRTAIASYQIIGSAKLPAIAAVIFSR